MITLAIVPEDLEGTWQRQAVAQNANRAHFVTTSGDAICHVLADRYQYLRLHGPWVEAEDWRHLCGFCRDLHPFPPPCECNICVAKRTSKAARNRRLAEEAENRIRRRK